MVLSPTTSLWRETTLRATGYVMAVALLELSERGRIETSERALELQHVVACSRVECRSLIASRNLQRLLLLIRDECQE